MIQTNHGQVTSSNSAGSSLGGALGSIPGSMAKWFVSVNQVENGFTISFSGKTYETYVAKTIDEVNQIIKKTVI